MESKFGLSFEIIDRERIGQLRRLRGFAVNPWSTGSRFIISHSLLTEEAYVVGLRDMLGDFRARALFILDEAHHAAPSGGARYAISSQLTRAVRDLAGRFEHRLYLSAGGLPDDAPELDLWRRLAAHGELRRKRIAKLPAHKAALAKMTFVGLQQRLLSSIPAFLRTVKAHRKTLQRLIEGEQPHAAVAAAQAFVDGSTTGNPEELALEDEGAEQDIHADEEAAAEAASIAGAAEASTPDLKAELVVVDTMLELADRHARRADARVEWLIEWIKTNFLSGKSWNNRRLIIFTEWEDTRRWLERRLGEAIADTDEADARIRTFTGVTGQDRREEVKAAFNADPAKEPLRILICTDAAREGINLQTYCSDLIHFDLPWNPSRLEQRNGRIDRKLQPAEQVYCRYFRYPVQRFTPA